MMFLYPSFLWALLAVLVPVIIHLFNFRRYKKVYFSNVKFLKELQLESKSRSRLREILVLIARCLAIAALVLAFARPYFEDPEQNRNLRTTTSVALYIDNSFSMENVSRQGPLLEVAKTRARELLKAFGETAKFYVVTNNFDGKEQRFYTRDNALEFIEDIKVSPAPRQLSQVYERQRSFLNNNAAAGAEIFLFSDVQKSTFNLPDLQPDSNFHITVLPLKANQVNNVYADSCWFDSPVQQKGFRQKVFASVVNSGNTDIEAGSARLYLNDAQVALSSFSVRAGGTATVNFSFWQKSEGFNFGRVEIEDYPITFDDVLYFAFQAQLNIGVTLINGSKVPADNPFTALFANDSIFSLKTFSEKAIDYGVFAGTDLIVLNQPEEISSGLLSELRKFAVAGGGIVIIPPVSPSPSYSAALETLGLPALGVADTVSTNVAPIDLASGFFEGVFEKMEGRVNMPLINHHFRTSRPANRLTDEILKLDNGDPFLLSVRKDNALVYLFTSPLLAEHSNFSRHALFVPAFFRIALSSVSYMPPYYGLHPEVMVSIRPQQRSAEQPPHIVGRDGKSDIIPEKRMLNNRMLLFPRSQVSMPGFYLVKQEGKDILPLAFNYSRTESDLDVYSVDELEKLVEEKAWSNVTVAEDVAAGIDAELLMGGQDRQLWKLFIILALVFFLTEILLLRFLK